MSKGANAIIRIDGNDAYVDVSTPKFPDAVAIISAIDLPLMLDGRGTWCAAKVKSKSDTLYVVRGIGGRKSRRTELLHRVILGLSNPLSQGDHGSGDGLDNRWGNLRYASNAQNSRNGRRHADGTSRFKGVSWDPKRKRWQAGIGIDRKRLALGRFKSEVAAARAYDKAALLHHGEFARLNFPLSRARQ